MTTITTNTKVIKSQLDSGNLAVIPTETVYGLAANAYNESAVLKIFQLKKRPQNNPLIVHIKSIEYLEMVAQNIPEKAKILARKFWPGPLTLVLEKQSHIPEIITAGKKTVAVRMPSHPITLELLNCLDYPLAAPSANPFGRISPTNTDRVFQYFKNDDLYILEGGSCAKGIESTIIGFDNEMPILHRHGAISQEEIEDIIGAVKSNTTNNIDPSAPGMLSSHYAPKTPFFVGESLEEFQNLFQGKKIGIIVLRRTLEFKKYDNVFELSSTGDLFEAATNLYETMQVLDAMKLDAIIAIKLSKSGIGRSINDRLERASKNN